MAHLVRDLFSLLNRHHQRVWHHASHTTLTNPALYRTPLRATTPLRFHSTSLHPHRHSHHHYFLHNRLRLSHHHHKHGGRTWHPSEHSFAGVALASAGIITWWITSGGEAHSEGIAAEVPLSRRSSLASEGFAEESSSSSSSSSSLAAELGARRRTLAINERVIPGTLAAGVMEVHTNSYAANPIIEDTFKTSESLVGGGSLFGVFDGHTGRAASAFCRDELFGFIEKSFAQSGPVLSATPFIEADRHFLTRALKNNIQDGLSGACLVVSHVTPEKITTANAGDCRAIVGRRRHKTETGFVWEAIELSRDHQISTNPAEAERLRREHPGESDIVYHNRVKGRLEPTRGLGDGLYKRQEYFDFAVKHNKKLQGKTWTPPYTTVEPEITEFAVEKDDMFLVLATDGLFGYMSSQEVVDTVGKYMETHKSRTPSVHAKQIGDVSASTHLITSALMNAGTRHQRRLAARGVAAAAASVTPIETLDAVMKIPSGEKRGVHDDVTAVVVFLSPRVPPALAAAAATATPAAQT